MKRGRGESTRGELAPVFPFPFPGGILSTSPPTHTHALCSPSPVPLPASFHVTFGEGLCSSKSNIAIEASPHRWTSGSIWGKFPPEMPWGWSRSVALQGLPSPWGRGRQTLDSPGLALRLTLDSRPSSCPPCSRHRVKVYKHEEAFDQSQTPRVLTVFCSKLQVRTNSALNSSREDGG